MTCWKYNAYKLILSVNISEYQLHATLKNFMIHLSVNQDIFSKKLKLIWIKDVAHRQALPYHEWLITGVLMISLILLPKQSRLKLNSGINLSILISCVNSGILCFIYIIACAACTYYAFIHMVAFTRNNWSVFNNQIAIFLNYFLSEILGWDILQVTLWFNFCRHLLYLPEDWYFGGQHDL